jgi:hypothetical protein
MNFRFLIIIFSGCQYTFLKKAGFCGIGILDGRGGRMKIFSGPRGACRSRWAHLQQISLLFRVCLGYVNNIIQVSSFCGSFF